MNDEEPTSAQRAFVRDHLRMGVVARGGTDLDGYALFDGLAFDSWQIAAGAQASAPIALARAAPGARQRLLIPSES